MRPLCVTAKLAGPVCMPEYGVALDACLAAAVCQRDQVPPAFTEAEVIDIEIPVAMEPSGRFHLCSNGVYTAEHRESRYKQRRPVIGEMQAMGDAVKTMRINAGPSKGYRIPFEVVRCSEDEIRWWMVGDEMGVRGLLDFVMYVGKHRAVGVGRVLAWTVEPCEPWGDGFPVVIDGQPLRALPPDWPGLVTPVVVDATLTYPYWLRERRQPCAIPTMDGFPR